MKFLFVLFFMTFYITKLLVDENSQPVAVSEWRLRRSALKQVLWMACVNLGYLNAPPTENDMQIDVEDTEEDEEEVEAILDGDNERRDHADVGQGSGFIPIADTASVPSTLPGDIPSEGNVTIYGIHV